MVLMFEEFVKWFGGEIVGDVQCKVGGFVLFDQVGF